MSTVIIETDDAFIITDSVYYDKKKHFLNYHVVGTNDYDNISDVDCKFDIDENGALLIITGSKISGDTQKQRHH